MNSGQTPTDLNVLVARIDERVGSLLSERALIMAKDTARQAEHRELIKNTKVEICTKLDRLERTTRDQIFDLNTRVVAIEALKNQGRGFLAAIVLLPAALSALGVYLWQQLRGQQ